MGKFTQTIFTTQGRKILLGDGNATYTRAVLSTADLSKATPEQVQALTDLSNVAVSTDTGVKLDSGTIHVIANFTNNGLKDDLNFTCVGWYAKQGNGDETLIAVSLIDGTKVLPAGSPDGSTDSLQLTLSIAVGNTKNVTVKVNPVDMVKPDDLLNLQASIKQELDTKANNDDMQKALAEKANSADVSASLNSKANSTDLDKTNAEVAKRATSEEVKQDVSDLEGKIAVKADQATVTDLANQVKANKEQATQELGKTVKGAKINGGEAVSPDASGILDLLIPSDQIQDLPKDVDFNSLAETGNYLGTGTIANYRNAKNMPLSPAFLPFSVVFVRKLSDACVIQAVYQKAENAFYYRVKLKNSFNAWQKININRMTDSEINNAIKNATTGILGKYEKTLDDFGKQIKAVTDLANSKVDASYSYSKTELDKKLLAASTTADGKVSTDQVAKMIASKDDTADVDKKIKTVTDLANSKANASDVYSKSQVDGFVNDAKNTAKQAQSTADSAQSQINTLNGSWAVHRYNNAVNLNDLWTTWGISYVMNGQNTNTPPFISDKRGTLFTFSFDGNGKWQLFFGCVGGIAWRSYFAGKGNWHKLSSDTDISNLQNQITNNDKGTIVTSYDWNKGNCGKETRTLQNAWLVDQQVLKGAVDRMNSINSNANGRLSLGGGNMNLHSTINWNGGGITDKTGNLGGLVWNGGSDYVHVFADQDANDNLDFVIQLGDDNSNAIVIRNNTGSQVARIDANGNITSPTINNLQNQVNTLKSQVSDLINQVNYIKANYVEGKRFSAGQEAQANSWENANPQRVAFISK